jgi:hypothetical protein
VPAFRFSSSSKACLYHAVFLALRTTCWDPVVRTTWSLTSSGGKTEYECVHCGHTSTLGKMNMAYLNIHTALECNAAPADVRLQVVRTTGSQHVVRKARNTAWYRQALEDEENRKAGTRKVQRRVTPPPTSSASSHGRITKPPSVTLGAPTKSTGRASPQTMANESPVDPERVKRINASLLGALNQHGVPLEMVDSARFRDFVICLNREYAPFVASAWMLMQTKTSGRPPSSGGGGAAKPAAVAPALAVLAEAATAGTAGTGSGSGRSGAGKGTKRARASDGDNEDSGKAKKRYIKEEMVRFDDDDSSDDDDDASDDDDCSIDRTKVGCV